MAEFTDFVRGLIEFDVSENAEDNTEEVVDEDPSTRLRRLQVLVANQNRRRSGAIDLLVIRRSCPPSPR